MVVLTGVQTLPALILTCLLRLFALPVLEFGKFVAHTFGIAWAQQHHRQLRPMYAKTGN